LKQGPGGEQEVLFDRGKADEGEPFGGGVPLMELTPGTYKQVFRAQDRVVLTVSQRWPHWEGDGRGLSRVNRFYAALARRWRRRWEGRLLDEAKQAGPESPPWRADLDFTVTLDGGGFLSVYLDAAEYVGQRRPRQVRHADVWAMPGGAPVTLRELLPKRRWWKGPVLDQVRRQIGAQVQAGEAIYYEDWPALVSREFSPDRFYLTKEGIVVFYPVESVAPALEGFPSFSLEKHAGSPEKA